MKLKYLTFAAAVAFSTQAFAANVTNGDFSSGLGGWSKTGNVGVINDDSYRGIGSTGSSGLNSYAVFGGGQFPGGSIFQTFTTVIGKTYTLSFDYAGYGGTSGQTLSYSIGNIASSVSVPAKWLTTNLTGIFNNESLTFVASSASTTLRFNDTSSSSTNADMFLGNVAVNNVTAVPGPEAGAGLGALAMGGVALYLKRRRKVEALAA